VWRQRWLHAVNCSRVYCRQTEKHSRPWSPAALVGQSVRPTMMNAGADGWSRRHDVCHRWYQYLNYLNTDVIRDVKWSSWIHNSIHELKFEFGIQNAILISVIWSAVPHNHQLCMRCGLFLPTAALYPAFADKGINTLQPRSQIRMSNICIGTSDIGPKPWMGLSLFFNHYSWFIS